MIITARRAFLALLLFAAGCAPPRGAMTDIAGYMPALAFTLTRANDSRTVTAEDYRDRVVILYFGYTNCPDECPTTLSDLATVLQRLGTKAQNVRVLFVSVDPLRDTPKQLKIYVSGFAPEIDGLRGSDDAVARLARRYRVTYRVTPASSGQAYEVMHSDSVFFFDKKGRARYVATSVANAPLIEKDVRELLE